MRSPTVNSNYRAMVCIFLAGGNDGHNTVIPISVPSMQEGYSLYLQGRQTLALPQASLQTSRTAATPTGCIRSCRKWRRSITRVMPPSWPTSARW
jgi:hypothetical protein